MTAGIYALYTQDNECLYVGQSKDCEARHRQHLTKLRRKRSSALPAFVAWFHEAGDHDELLTFKVLEAVAEPQARNVAELAWFHKLSPRFYGKTPSLSKVWDHSEEVKENISRSLRASEARGEIPCSSCKKLTKAQRGLCRACLRKEKKELFERCYGKEIMAYYEQNHSLRTIAEKLKLPHVTVQRYMKDQEIQVVNQRFAGKKHSEAHMLKLRETVSNYNKSKRHAKTCLKCSSTFITKSSDRRKFCTRLCYRNSFKSVDDIVSEV